MVFHQSWLIEASFCLVRWAMQITLRTITCWNKSNFVNINATSENLAHVIKLNIVNIMEFLFMAISKILIIWGELSFITVNLTDILTEYNMNMACTWVWYIACQRCSMLWFNIECASGMQSCVLTRTWLPNERHLYSPPRESFQTPLIYMSTAWLGHIASFVEYRGAIKPIYSTWRRNVQYHLAYSKIFLGDSP